jgi:choline-sulfatase
LIITDQQSADAMSAVMGTEYIHTPNMDALAANGMRFTRAYTPNPLCMPMRTSMFTGDYPHVTGIQTNGGEGFDPTQHVFMGKRFRDAGYETAYFGKWHIPLDEDAKDVHGFDTFVGRPAILDPEPAAAFVETPHDRPFLAVASFLGPHEICQWSRRQDLPGEPLPEPPPVEEWPPLPDNFAPPEGETDIIAHMRQSYQAHRLFPVGNYTDDDWRRLIWGYYRLVERVDAFMGTVLEALRRSGQEENTVVLFLSDHGDCHGAHHWNQKTVFYDESTRVPYIVSWKGHTPAGTSDLLINTGVDTIPTLCDFASIAVGDDLPGKSLKAAALGGRPAWQRDFVVSENHMVQCEPVDGVHLCPQGRMVRSDRYKYCAYSVGTRRESLVDMVEDPGEMRNLADDQAYHSILAQHRAYLRAWCQEHGDNFVVPGG